jgi:hypothetical protein
MNFPKTNTLWSWIKTSNPKEYSNLNTISVNPNTSSAPFIFLSKEDAHRNFVEYVFKNTKVGANAVSIWKTVWNSEKTAYATVVIHHSDNDWLDSTFLVVNWQRVTNNYLGITDCIISENWETNIAVVNEITNNGEKTEFLVRNWVKLESFREIREISVSKDGKNVVYKAIQHIDDQNFKEVFVYNSKKIENINIDFSQWVRIKEVTADWFCISARSKYSNNNLEATFFFGKKWSIFAYVDLFKENNDSNDLNKWKSFRFKYKFTDKNWIKDCTTLDNWNILINWREYLKDFL